MSEENEVPSADEKIAEKIIESVSAIINGTFKRKDLLDTISNELSALRASWEKEKDIIEKQFKWADEAREYWKKQFEFVVDKSRTETEMIRDGYEKKIEALKSEKQALEAEKKGLEERVNDLESKMNEVTNCCTWEGYVDAVRSLKKKFSEEITRLKAENEMLKNPNRLSIPRIIPDDISKEDADRMEER